MLSLFIWLLSRQHVNGEITGKRKSILNTIILEEDSVFTAKFTTVRPLYVQWYSSRGVDTHNFNRFRLKYWPRNTTVL